MPGYFDSIKADKATARTLTVAPAPSNVIPLRDNVHPYAAAIRSAWLGRLDDLPRPWFKGAAWDNNCFVTARKLVELANSPWAGYSLDEARNDYLFHAPHDQAWDGRQKCWDQALKRSGNTALPEPEPNAPPDVTVLVATTDLPAPTSSDAETELAQLVRTRFPLLDFIDLLGSEDDGEEWIVEPILAARRLVALYSAPKVGKSLLMLEIAIAIALGREVLGVTPEPKKVLYVDFENDPRGDIRRRLEAMGFGPEDGAELNAGLCYLSFPSLAKLDTQQGGFELLSTAQEYGCEVVVIDTVSRAVGGEENDNDTWLAFYRDTGMRLKGAGIACIRLDHSGKDAEKGMRGGSAKYGDVDAVWKLSAESETVLNLDCTDHRMPIEHDRLTLIRETYPDLRHRLVTDRTLALDARENEIGTALDGLQVPVGTSAKESYRLLQEAGKGFNKSRVFRVVKARNLRLETVAEGGSGTPLEPPGTPLAPGTGGGVPGAPYVVGLRNPPLPGGSREAGPPSSELLPDGPETLVSCTHCFKPTTAGVATRNSGLCATCHRNAGMEN